MLKLVRDPLKYGNVDIITQPKFEKLVYRKHGEEEDIAAYLGWEPSVPPEKNNESQSGVKSSLQLGNLVAAQPLMRLEELGFRIIFLDATEHAYINKKGTREQIQEWARDLDQQVTKLFTAPVIIHGDEYQLGSSYTERDIKEEADLKPEEIIRKLKERSENTNEYREILETIWTLPEGVLKRASAEVMSESAAGSAAVYSAMQLADIEWLRRKHNVQAVVSGGDQDKIHGVARDNFEQKLHYPVPTFFQTELLLSLSGRLEKVPDREPPKIRVPKMSKSEGDRYVIYLSDKPDEIREKIKGAFCPPYKSVVPDSVDFNTSEGVELDFNPIASIIKNVINIHCDKLKIERPLKYGGNKEDEPLKILEMYKKGFESKGEGIHPEDLKFGVGEALVKLISQVQ